MGTLAQVGGTGYLKKNILNIYLRIDKHFVYRCSHNHGVFDMDEKSTKL